MKILLFDTETTGLPKTRESATKRANNWPHLVSIAWVVLENDVQLKERYFIVKPEGWVVPPESTAIHGITHAQAEQEGISLKDVIQTFLNEEHDIMIAHNMNFDLNVIINAVLWDLNLPLPNFKPLFCSMELMTPVCKLPSKFGGYKPPKLSELYEFIFKVPPKQNQLHNSLYDTQLLRDIILRSTILRPLIGLPAVGVESNNVYSKKVLVI